MPLRTFKRPNYFLGKLLSVEDFQREQEYHRDKNRLRNRLLIGPGIVAGLRVSVEQQELVVSPGVAIDCQGNELVLAAEHRQPLSGKSGRHWVTVRYAETPGGSVPSLGGPMEASYIEETVAVEVLPSPLACTDQGDEARLQGCAQPHAVALAAIRFQGTRWRLRPSQRKRQHRG